MLYSKLPTARNESFAPFSKIEVDRLPENARFKLSPESRIRGTIPSLLKPEFYRAFSEFEVSENDIWYIRDPI